MPDNALPWDVSLRQSVEALRAAAEETHRFAHQVGWMTRRADPAHRVRREGAATGPHGLIEPHREAIERIERLTLQWNEAAKAEFEMAALQYAYGTAAALSDVLRGRTPEHAEMPADESSALAMLAIPNLADALAGWYGTDALVVLRDELAYRQRCRVAVRTFETDTAPDHMAGAYMAAMQAAEGLAKAAFGFGWWAELALRHLMTRKEKEDGEA